MIQGPIEPLDVDRGKEATNSNESKRILALNGWYQDFPGMIGSLMSDVLNPEGVNSAWSELLLRDSDSKKL